MTTIYAHTPLGAEVTISASKPELQGQHPHCTHEVRVDGQLVFIGLRSPAIKAFKLLEAGRHDG